jgi:hypothetical protein
VQLVTVNEAGKILGTPVAAGKQKTRTAQGITGDRCVWSAKKKGTGGLKGRPLELEVVVESGTTLVGEYNSARSADPTETEAVPGLGDDAFIKDLKLHVLVGERVLSTALHNYRYPKPLTQQQIQQKDAAKLVGRLSPTSYWMLLASDLRSRRAARRAACAANPGPRRSGRRTALTEHQQLHGRLGDDGGVQAPGRAAPDRRRTCGTELGHLPASHGHPGSFLWCEGSVPAPHC